MTELQMGLIGLGAVAVAGVLAYNKWQETRQGKQVEDALGADHPDILLEGGMVPLRESATDAPESTDDETFSPAHDLPADETRGERIEPVLRPDPEREPPEPSPPPVPASPAPSAASPRDDGIEAFLSPRMDFIAAIDFVEPVPEQRILDAPRAALVRLRKPMRWIGQDEASGEWRPMTDGEGEYRRIRVGLQLVDRRGPVDADDLAVFAAAMQDLADSLTGIAELPARPPALETAAELDRFCASVDIQIGINVISQEQAFPGTKLRALAESAGMVIDGEGRFARRDDDGNPLYVMQNQGEQGFAAETMRLMTAHALTFLLDVPNVANGERAFNQMIDQARRFAEVLRGALVDDNRRPLSDAALDPIRRQIAQHQSAMAAQRLPAGSPLARRLFS